ncbi:hypothetical protein PAMC26577_34735 [Caballeronia sordidicola]|uniref:Uncharacterized protein n=1 Tax=Caballeronia sordidicola TaxID=196367 RepID=A0A242MAX4_CABSO|nr:hypothetical protein PAMC26577_34735 [Caballeronia sordidicola]
MSCFTEISINDDAALLTGLVANRFDECRQMHSRIVSLAGK